MSRLQTKFFFASVGFHATLVGLVLSVAAFAPQSAPAPEKLTLLTLMPRLRDDELVGGGNPDVTAAPAPPVGVATPEPELAPDPAPVPPKPEPIPEPPPKPIKPEKPTPPRDEFKELFEKEPKPTPNPAELKRPKPETHSKPKKLDPKPENKKAPDIEVNLKQTKVGDSKAKKERLAREQAESKRVSDENAARLQAWAKGRNSALTSAVSGLSSSLSPSTVVEMPGPGGEFYASYRQFVYTKYNQAWQPPADLEDDRATVEVEVVIARDGRVISSAVTSRSGNPTMNKSIEGVLTRVRFVHPFPDGAKDNERTFKIRFNLRAKRQTG